MTDPDTKTSSGPSKRRASPTSQRGQRRRQEILQAAITVFGRLGFTQATMLDIATEAGVASGTVYQYFDDKADVFRRLLDDLEQRLHRETRMPAGSDGRLVVHDSVLTYLAVYHEYEALFRAWWDVLEPPTEFTDAWVALHQKSCRELTDVIEQGKKRGLIAGDVVADITAELIVSTFERPAYLHMVLGWDEDITDDELAATMARLLGSGFTGKRS